MPPWLETGVGVPFPSLIFPAGGRGEKGRGTESEEGQRWAPGVQLRSCLPSAGPSSGALGGGCLLTPPPPTQARSPPCSKPTELPRTQQLAPGCAPGRTGECLLVPNGEG